MKIMPVKRRRKPEYPDKYSIQFNNTPPEDKTEKRKYIPIAGVAVSAVVALGLAGCGGESKPANISTSGAIQTASSNIDYVIMGDVPVPTVSPVFITAPAVSEATPAVSESMPTEGLIMGTPVPVPTPAVSESMPTERLIMGTHAPVPTPSPCDDTTR